MTDHPGHPGQSVPALNTSRCRTPRSLSSLYTDSSAPHLLGVWHWSCLMTRWVLDSAQSSCAASSVVSSSSSLTQHRASDRLLSEMLQAALVTAAGLTVRVAVAVSRECIMCLALPCSRLRHDTHWQDNAAASTVKPYGLSGTSEGLKWWGGGVGGLPRWESEKAQPAGPGHPPVYTDLTRLT